MITDNRVLFHRVATTLNYLDIKTVVVSCGTCYDQLQGYEFGKIFPGSRIIDIHEYLLEKGVTLQGKEGYLYHDPCHSPMKLQDPMKTVKALVGDGVIKSERCCGESGTLGVTRPDISTQIRFRKEEELKRARRAAPAAPLAEKDNVKILTSCPSCLQGLSRYGGDMNNGLLEADYRGRDGAPDPGRELDGRICSARQRRRHRTGSGLMAASASCPCAPQKAACPSGAAGACE